MRVLLTGATGFVGSELARALLRAGELERLVLTVRPLAGLTAEDRWQRQIAHWRRFVPMPSERLLKRVEVVAHDLELPQALAVDGGLDMVIHSAANTDVRLPLGVNRRANVFPTQRMLRFAERIKGLQCFMHISTAYVCGQRRGLIKEDDAPEPFHNHYERTKWEAEDAVRCADVPWTIVRPSMIVGRSDDGYYMRMKVLYSVWRTWLMGQIPRAPIDAGAWADLVPVDYVVDATLALARLPTTRGHAYHLTAGEGRVRPRDVMRIVTNAWEAPPVPFSPPWIVDILRLPFVKPMLPTGMQELLDSMHQHVPYLGIRDRCFDMSRTDRLLVPLGLRCPAFASYGERLFRFAKATAWGKKALVAEETCSKSA